MDQDPNNPGNANAAQQADDRLVHGLLLHLHDDQAAAHRERRVQRAVRAIGDPATPTSAGQHSDTERPGRILRFPLWARRGAWAAAALIAVAVGVWVFSNSATPAMAALGDIITALASPGDRSYHVQMRDLPEPPGRRQPAERPSAGVPKPGLDDAKLYLRDSHQYLLVRHDPNSDKLIYDGYDGQRSWRVRGGRLAETKEGLGAGGIPVPPMMADVPFSDLHQTLERVQTTYKVEQAGEASLPSGGSPLRYVRVRRNSREVKGPETIEIWADLRTAMPVRIVFDDAKVQGNQTPCRLTLDLVSEEPLAPDWFSSSSHASEDQ